LWEVAAGQRGLARLARWGAARAALTCCHAFTGFTGDPASAAGGLLTTLAGIRDVITLVRRPRWRRGHALLLGRRLGPGRPRGRPVP
jgi:hypothetical protein